MIHLGLAEQGLLGADAINLPQDPLLTGSEYCRANVTAA